MKNRILLGALLGVLALSLTPINQASAEHITTKPCDDPDVQVAGAVQTGSFDHPDYDVWTDPGGGPLLNGSYMWVVNADAPIQVTSWIETSNGSCRQWTGNECVETHAPYTCHRMSSNDKREWIVIEKGPFTGNTGHIDYELLYVGADPL